MVIQRGDLVVQLYLKIVLFIVTRTDMFVIQLMFYSLIICLFSIKAAVLCLYTTVLQQK